MDKRKIDIKKALPRPMGLVAEFKTPIDFASEVLKEIPFDEAFKSQKRDYKGKFVQKKREVIFINGKAFVKEDIL